ncbi:MAG: ATP-binding protein [Planctomycetota bacterium]|jgi:serine/threonine-protein kinase RsbW|nr:ATP-binding protein [Blastopirellula sp.]
MNGTSTLWNLECRFASDHGRACELTEEIIGRLGQLGWSESDRFAVQIGLEEGLMNAIKHGNRGDAGKFVDLKVEVTPDEIYIRIGDEGCGFSSQAVPNPTLKVNRRRDSGRGVALIRGFMDSVQYNDCGNQLEMRKRRSPSAEG